MTVRACLRFRSLRILTLWVHQPVYVTLNPILKRQTQLAAQRYKIPDIIEYAELDQFLNNRENLRLQSILKELRTIKCRHRLSLKKRSKLLP